MIYIIQLLTLFYAIAFGIHDAQAVDVFRRSGYYKKEDGKAFHASGFFMRLFIGATLVLLYFTYQAELLKTFLLALSVSAIMWAAFDISLNLSRQNGSFPWDYAGSEAALDKLQGKSIRLKTYICAAVIIIANTLMLIL